MAPEGRVLGILRRLHLILPLGDAFLQVAQNQRLPFQN